MYSRPSSVLDLKCFVCDENIVGKGIPLLMSVTNYTKTELPTKIGQLMGDGFMVVVSVDDSVCKRCSSLLNHIDKLELDLDLVKAALTGYLNVKYQLNEHADIHNPQNLPGGKNLSFSSDDAPFALIIFE